MRAPGVVVIVAALSVGSVAVAALSTIDAPAAVGREADRLAPPFRPDRTGTERAAADVVELVNAERSGRGLPILVPHRHVAAAATAHAVDMASRGSMVHFGVDGSDTGDRLERAGFTWRTWGESIGAGYATPELIFDAWMAGDEDRAHVLSENTSIGVGVAATPGGTPYWVLVVAT